MPTPFLVIRRSAEQEAEAEEDVLPSRGALRDLPRLVEKNSWPPKNGPEDGPQETTYPHPISTGELFGRGSEPQHERRADLKMAQEKGALIEPLSPQPTGDLVVPLAGVAGATGRHDVVQGVAPAT